MSTALALKIILLLLIIIIPFGLVMYASAKKKIDDGIDGIGEFIDGGYEK